MKIINDEVIISHEDITSVTRNEIEYLKQKAKGNMRRRIRLCAHKSIEDRLHEMLIVVMKGAYIRPHKHMNKSESLLVMEGQADAILFDEQGNITRCMAMGEYTTDRRFYYRLSDSVYHGLVIQSEFFVFHESTIGPFKRDNTLSAPWSPKEEDVQEVSKFLKNLSIVKNKITPLGI